MISVLLGVVLVLLNTVDCVMTYIGCKKHHVRELNPVGHWLFVHIGILPSLGIKLLLVISIVSLFIVANAWQMLLVCVVFYLVLTCWNSYRLYCIRKDKKNGKQNY